MLLTICMLGLFMLLLSSADFFFKIIIFSFKNIFHHHYLSVKRFGSGSKLFAKAIRRRQKSPLARMELMQTSATWEAKYTGLAS